MSLRPSIKLFLPAVSTGQRVVSLDSDKLNASVILATCGSISCRSGSRTDKVQLNMEFSLKLCTMQNTSGCLSVVAAALCVK